MAFIKFLFWNGTCLGSYYPEDKIFSAQTIGYIKVKAQHNILKVLLRKLFSV